MTTEHKTGIQGWAWVNIVVGLLVLATPFITGDTGTVPLWNAIILGLIVAGLAGYNAYVANQAHTERAMMPAMINILAGIYIIAMPFFMTVSTTYRWAMVVFGVIVLVGAAYNTWAASDAKKNVTTTV